MGTAHVMSDSSPSIPVRDLMTREAFRAPPDTDLRHPPEMLLPDRVGGLPAAGNETPVGLRAETDCLRHLGRPVLRR